MWIVERLRDAVRPRERGDAAGEGCDLADNVNGQGEAGEGRRVSIQEMDMWQEMGTTFTSLTVLVMSE